MPTSTGGDRINFHYNYGDYNNDLKTLTQTQTPNTLLVLSQINREHPIIFRQIARQSHFLTLVHTHRRSSFLSLYLTQELSLAHTPVYSQSTNSFSTRETSIVKEANNSGQAIHATFNA